MGELVMKWGVGVGGGAGRVRIYVSSGFQCKNKIE